MARSAGLIRIIMAGALWSGLLTGPLAAQDYGAVAPVDSVTLEQAVERALQFSPQVVQARTSLSTADFATKQAYASMLPSVSFSSGASLSSSDRFDQQTGLRVSGQSNNYNAGLSSSMDLFAGGRNLAAVRSARAGAEAADATVVTQQFSVTLSAKQAFFAVLRARDLIRLNEEQIDQAEQQLEAAERRMQVGGATRSDVLRARLQLSNARQALLQSTVQHRNAMYSLGQTVGAAGPVTAMAASPIEPEPLALSEEAMREVVLSQAPTVVSALADVRVAEAGIAQARAQYFPSIGISGGYNWSNREFGLEQGLTSWSTRLNLSLPLFNRLQREGTAQRAGAQLTLAEARAADAARQAVAQFESLLAGLRLAEEQLALLNESVEVAREDYRVQQERYQVGAATILELVSSQIALSQAENALINARYDYQIARAELESLVGREL